MGLIFQNKTKETEFSPTFKAGKHGLSLDYESKKSKRNNPNQDYREKYLISQ